MAQVALHVSLLAHTPCGGDVVARASRLCYSASRIADLDRDVEQSGGAEAYLDRLMSLGHLSPVEHASFTFGVEGVSRALLAQITRHRIASFSVQSQRYVKNTELDYVIPPSIQALGEEAAAEYREQMKTLHGWYLSWLERTGRAEDARFVLPNAAATRMILTMNARELTHFFQLRCCSRAQWEIRALAWAMLGLAQSAEPLLFRHAGSACVGGGCSEGKMTCGKPEQIREKARRLRALCADPATAPGDIVAWAIKNA